jgi:hypothetical protein
MATVLPSATNTPVPDVIDDCAFMGDMQICWGRKKLQRDPKAQHTAAFTFTFKEEFLLAPVVTQAINVDGSGHAMEVYSWSLDTKTYSGNLNNMYIGKPVEGVITMSYIAIGKPKPKPK